MKAITVRVFASFLFVLMSFKVRAVDPNQTVFPNLDPSDVQKPDGQLSRLKRYDHSPQTRAYNLKVAEDRAKQRKQQGWANKPVVQPKKSNSYKSPVVAKKAPTPVKQPEKPGKYTAVQYMNNREKERLLIKKIREIATKAGKNPNRQQKDALDKMRGQLRQIKLDAIKHRSFLLEKFYGKYFSQDDDKIVFKLPARPLKNCVLQAMVDPSFSPSCKADRTYSAKQCAKKRCWCSTSRGTMLYRLKENGYGGPHKDGFHYGTKGLTLRCPRN